ncbi:MAG TPA: aminotransferase class I/II-fold pyridoxal phosphate-dependent enzyme [Candidatus Dormibacteraeota bacterium]|nr:aminotransferase class I/II-fold pyridoxal phosphate-dependent enzyme [Candidatus Dormibacteraeota bacterium]
MNLPVHGGDLADVAERYGVAAAGLLDFSANINPLGPPPSVVRAMQNALGSPISLAPYPHPTALPLRCALAAKHETHADGIVVANGSSATIDAAVRAFGARGCVLPIPAFSEYERALNAAGAAIYRVGLNDLFVPRIDSIEEMFARSGARLCLLSHPHNPSGVIYELDLLIELYALCTRYGAMLALDEAFIDYAPERSLIGEASRLPNLIVLRSLTKFYGIAGVRIGYAVASEANAAAMRAVLPTWSVGVLDIAAALAAIDDEAFAQTTLATNQEAREHLRERLTAAGTLVYQSAANFLLVELPISAESMDAFLHRLVVDFQIVVRDTRSYDGLATRSCIRVAVRTPSENERLVAAIESLLDVTALGRSPGARAEVVKNIESGCVGAVDA